MTKNKDGFLEGNGIIILILFFLMFGGGFGGWNNSATQNAVTRAEMQDAFATQNLGNSINSLAQSVNTGFANTALAMNNGFNSVNSNISSLGTMMQNCCCDLRTAVHSEGEATRSLIQQNTIQDLRDKVADKDRELLATGLVTAQTVQTNNLENFIRTILNGGCSCGC